MSEVVGISPTILIPACVSSNQAFHKMYSADKLNMQGDIIQPWNTPFPIWNQSIVPCPVLSVASWPTSSFEGRKDKEISFSLIVKVLFASSCQSLCNPRDCSPPGYSVHGILRQRILEWVAMPFSRGSSWPKDWNWASCITGRIFTVWAPREHSSYWHLNFSTMWPISDIWPKDL